MGIEPTRPAWKAGILAIELHPHKNRNYNNTKCPVSQVFYRFFKKKAVQQPAQPSEFYQQTSAKSKIFFGSSSLSAETVKTNSTSEISEILSRKAVSSSMSRLPILRVASPKI